MFEEVLSNIISIFFKKFINQKNFIQFLYTEKSVLETQKKLDKQMTLYYLIKTKIDMNLEDQKDFEEFIVQMLD